MKETVTQSSFSEKINWKDYVVSITKCGNGYQLQLQMKAQLDNMNYDDVKLIVVDLFNRFRMDMSDKVVDNKWAYVVMSGSTEELSKKKRGRPKKNQSVVTTDDVKKKAKKLKDDYDFFSNLPKDNTFSELGSRDYVFKWKKK